MEKLKNLDTDNRVAIIMHDTPDADCMGSAVGLEWFITKKFGLSCDKLYGGEISHPENKAMVNILDLDFKSESEWDPERYSYIATVDCTKKNTSLLDEEMQVDMVIDHHRISIREEDYDFVKHEHVGACATLIYEMIKEYDMELDEEEDETVITALLFGIIKDTNHTLSERTTSADFEAHRELMPMANTKNIFSIKQYPLPSYIFDLESVARKQGNYKEVSGTFITFLGYINESKRDALHQIAEKYMRKEGIKTAVVTAIVGEHIQASVRSNVVNFMVEDFVKNVFGSDYAGGKKGQGGAKVPLGLFSISGDDEELKEETIELIKKKLLSRIESEVSKDS